MPTRKTDQASPSAVPAVMGGKWIAWNAEHTQIVAQAESMYQIWQQVKEKQIDDPIFEKVPFADVRFVGAR
jgi:hypothetical protein